MKPLLLLLSIPILMLAMSTAAQSAPIYNLYWGTDCIGAPAPVNQDFDGPRVYQQVLSIQGLIYPTKGYEAVIHIGPTVPDCWNFLPDGCANQAGFDVTASTQATPSCPSPLGPYPDSVSLTVEDNSCKPGQSCGGYGVRLTNFYNEASFPQPSIVQLLGVFDWDLGSVDQGTCAGEFDMLCFHVVSVGFLMNDGVTWNYQTAPGRDYATFNDPANALLCPLPVQALQSTWGRVKSLYR